jgi:2-iminobutanoate/2-iminopropanoate deaminase
VSRPGEKYGAGTIRCDVQPNKKSEQSRKKGPRPAERRLSLGTITTNAIHEIGIANQIGRYSDGVEVTNSRRLLFISGTPGLTTQGHLSSVFEEQAEQGWKNVLALLKSAGMEPQHLVKISQYLVRSEDISRYSLIRAKWLGDYRPASMLVVVPGLVRPEFLIEIEAYTASA